MTTDILIIGAGPAGIFTALEMLRKGSRKKITIVEKGAAIENRHCPKVKTGQCMNCKPYCHITTGFSGAGAFSDGKLSLSYEVGGQLPELIGENYAQQMIDYTDQIYLQFGADSRVEGIGQTEEIKRIRLRAIQAGLKLVDCPIRHLGTEKAQILYKEIENYLISQGVEILFGHNCANLLLEGIKCVGVEVEKKGITQEIRAEHTVVATGRRGADWLERLCEEHGIAHQPGTVDIGVRVEVRNEVMETVNRVLYESKLVGYPRPFKDKVRTFCQNPGGFVSQENYDNDLAVVNGHSYKELKTDNTNLAILCSHNFTHPFNQPIAYAQKVGELTNMLGSGQILVQRFGDIMDGKRTWQKELSRANVRPTLPDAVAGDITAAMPYRAMTNIINFMQAMDHVVPGFAGPETLLYSPELKFYSNRIKMNQALQTNIEGLHCLGDSSGWTRGLMMASVMGVIMGQQLAKEG
ncbi:MAG: FAD-dependent oxidoreductase [Clostridia bacterium]|nr:FAD-dependent oxidoreductase [Clostridia bacterium]MBR6185170.1 FAD-dependent oxidoreductase [Clostridia bacterium]